MCVCLHFSCRSFRAFWINSGVRFSSWVRVSLSELSSATSACNLSIWLHTHKHTLFGPVWTYKANVSTN